MENKTTKFLPIAIAVIGLLIALYGVVKQSKGGGSALVWVGVAITFAGVFLSTAAAVKKPKD